MASLPSPVFFPLLLTCVCFRVGAVSLIGKHWFCPLEAEDRGWGWHLAHGMSGNLVVPTLHMCLRVVAGTRVTHSRLTHLCLFAPTKQTKGL